MQILQILTGAACILLFFVLWFVIYLIGVLCACKTCPHKKQCRNNKNSDFVPPCQHRKWFSSLPNHFGNSLW